jgi:hypothetical protein
MMHQSGALARLASIVLISLAGIPAATCFATVQATFHVAPDGSDSTLGGEANPFATIERAKRAVRAMNKDMSGDIVVMLHGGA